MHHSSRQPSPEQRRPVRVGDKVFHQSGCEGVVESLSSSSVARVRVGPMVIECTTADIRRAGDHSAQPRPPEQKPTLSAKPLPHVTGLTPKQVAQLNAEYLELWGRPPDPPTLISPGKPKQEKAPPLPQLPPLVNEPRKWVGPPPQIGDWVYVDLCGFDIRGRINALRSGGNLVVHTTALTIETDHQSVHRAPPPGQNTQSFSIGTTQGYKRIVEVCDVHGFSIQKLESWLHRAVPEAARSGVESMQVIHGYRRGDILMRRLHQLAAEAPFVDFIERAYYRPEANPGITKLLLR
jgi:hypothetical protein